MLVLSVLLLLLLLQVKLGVLLVEVVPQLLT
jgi:hypothetical protein